MCKSSGRIEYWNRNSMGRKILKIETDFDQVFIYLPRLVVNSLKWQFAHPFTVFKFDLNLTIFLKFLQNSVFHFSWVLSLFFKSQLRKISIELRRIPILLWHLIVRTANFEKSCDSFMTDNLFGPETIWFPCASLFWRN